MKALLSQAFTVQERKRSSFSSDHGFRDYYRNETWRVMQNCGLGGSAVGLCLGCLLMWAAMKGTP